jgi:hypothetical protein
VVAGSGRSQQRRRLLAGATGVIGQFDRQRQALQCTPQVQWLMVQELCQPSESRQLHISVTKFVLQSPLVVKFRDTSKRKSLTRGSSYNALAEVHSKQYYAELSGLCRYQLKEGREL